MRNIVRGAVKRRSPVNEYQARYFAKVIRRFEEAWSRQFRRPVDLSFETYQRFREMPEFEDFMDAALACGFVCSDFRDFAQVEQVHESECPSDEVASLTFSELRHYVHTLQRAEKWNSDYSRTLWASLQTGALSAVARRLESDNSLYESDGE